MDRKQAWTLYQEKDYAAIEELCSGYRRFLNAGKTERECVEEAIRIAEQKGYRNLSEYETVKTGDKIYAVHMNKTVVFFHIGEQWLEEGINIIGAHVDSPRLDIKQVPFYEDSSQVYLDTHYYGGVKTYQWLSLPLALHGVIVKKDGTKVTVRIGETEEDPVFVITDLLPHLGKEKLEEKVKEFIDAEKMDLLIGNRGEITGTAKEYILQILYKRYQIQEEDFVSAELEVVPAGKARDCGLDSSMILGYGQDDRSCAYAALEALMEMADTTVLRTSCCILADKEETGSRGATGMTSHFFENVLAEIVYRMEEKREGYIERVEKQSQRFLLHQKQDLMLRRILQESDMLSADVSAAYDPLYEKYFEKKNAAYLSEGLVFSKYSGSGGKSGGNDANAEYMAKLRCVMEENRVLYQTAELGAVDRGGGGTIAYILAEYGMNVIDCGIAVLSMHAPWEVISKADLYEMKKGYQAFYQKYRK